LVAGVARNRPAGRGRVGFCPGFSPAARAAGT